MALEDAGIPFLDVLLDVEIQHPLRALGVSDPESDALDGTRVQYALHNMLMYQGVLSPAEEPTAATVPQLFQIDCASNSPRTRYIYIGDSHAIAEWARALH